MRRLVQATALVCFFSVEASGFYESFYFPVVVEGSVHEIAGVAVEFVWNTAMSLPTVRHIQPMDISTRPVILSRTGSATEVAASAAEFVDAHPE